jgi:hypothetical protein
VTAVIKFILSLIGTGGLVALLSFFGDLRIPWWGFTLVLGIVGWLFLTAGMALQLARGPLIEIGRVRLDKDARVFWVPIKNGSSPSRVTIKVNHVEDALGNPRIEHAWEGHWRGKLTRFDGTLIANEKAQYGLIGVGESTINGRPSLFIYSREAGGFPIEDGHTGVPLSRDMALGEQGKITVEFVATCENSAAERGSVEERVFSIIPDPGSNVGYKLESNENKPGVFSWLVVQGSQLSGHLDALRASLASRFSKRER